MPKEAYLERVPGFIRENADHLIGQLHTNQPITAAELQELERILFDGQKEEQKSISRRNSVPLNHQVFLSEHYRLDVKAANEAFSEFLGKENMHAG